MAEITQRDWNRNILNSSFITTATPQFADGLGSCYDLARLETVGWGNECRVQADLGRPGQQIGSNRHDFTISRMWLLSLMPDHLFIPCSI